MLDCRASRRPRTSLSGASRSRSAPKGVSCPHRPRRARLAHHATSRRSTCCRPPPRCRSRSRATSRRSGGFARPSTRSRTSTTCRATTTPSSSSATPTSSLGQLESPIGEERERGADRRASSATALHGHAPQRVHPPAVRARRRRPTTWSVDAEPRGARDDRRSVRQPADRRRASRRPRRAREVPARGVRSLPGGLVPGQRGAGLRLLHPAVLRSGANVDGVRYSFTGRDRGSAARSSTAATSAGSIPRTPGSTSWTGESEPVLIASICELARS